VGSRTFVEKVKALLGSRAKGREIIERDEGFQVREGSVAYNAPFEAEKEHIGPQNGYFRNIAPE